MMGNVTWEMLGFLGGLLSLVIGLWARLERRLRGTEREAHAKIEGVEKSLADYKLEVAKNYASNQHLKDLEARLLDSIRQVNDDIRALPKTIADLMGSGGRTK